tara:strand:+ start:423 stop:914 length:492 start_codon:yes stop_codon:yes gene_type:complete
MEKNKFPNLSNIFHLIAVGFGSGLINTAPGTWGSSVILILFTIAETFINNLLYLFIIVFSLLTLFLLSCIAASNDADIKDDSRIVSDEMGGMLFALYLISLISDEIFGYLIGFALFRFFDIVKPWPISYVDQNLKNGFGVFLDDLIAGFLSFLVFLCFYLLFT